MTNYWCRFFDEHGYLFAAEQVHAQNDASAIAMARAIFVDHIASDFEIQDGTRIVIRQAVETSFD